MDPVHQNEDGKWYWYDETWSEYGPYETEDEAKQAVKYDAEHYVKHGSECPEEEKPPSGGLCDERTMEKVSQALESCGFFAGVKWGDQTNQTPSLESRMNQLEVEMKQCSEEASQLAANGEFEAALKLLDQLETKWRQTQAIYLVEEWNKYVKKLGRCLEQEDFECADKLLKEMQDKLITPYMDEEDDDDDDDDLDEDEIEKIADRMHKTTKTRN